MLRSLSIQNFAIIEKLEINFEKGFSVITGETGAGKSIIMGALAMVLGQRADSKTIKQGAEKCLIEACFEIQEYSLQSFFDENDLDYADSCIIRREILANGKSRSFVNDTPASLSTLKNLGEKLIDIHSQYENLLLKDNLFQLNVIDTIAKNEKERAEYQKHFNRFKLLSQQLNELIEANQKNSADKEYLEFQYSQLETAKLQPDEQEELENELKQLTHAEEIKTELNKINLLLSNDMGGVIVNLKEGLNSIRRIKKFMPESEGFEERLNSCYIDIKDLSAEIEVKQNDIDFDPQRIEYINQRLDLIYSMEHKHRVSTISELLDLQNEFEQKLHKIASFDEEIDSLKKQIEAAELQAAEAAKTLTNSRVKISKQMEDKLVKQLKQLGMPHVRFNVTITEKQALSANGNDETDFLFSANEHAPLLAVSEIASGGEISRVMLSLKSLIASSKTLPTIIFDEIDTGVSGEIADKMAEIMRQMSTEIQVLCITHLPQIAAKGQNHFKVYKDQSTTNIKKLTSSERVTEIAQMLSGSNLSEAAVLNAKTLLSTN
ncbi:MAG: DNA repair protein RecN [Paludibacteraceae bacterium]|nr:DNA repair protein RecN [Paludibacteraceae bacterium]